MTHRTVQTAHINVPVAQSHSPPPCFVGPLMCSRDRTYSSFRRTASRNEQPETSSLQRITPHEHLSHDLVDYRGHPGRFRGDRRSHHRPNRHSGIGGDCRSADRRGFTLAATDHTSYYPTTANSPDDCATRRRYVGGRSGHCHRIDHARRRSCPTADTADGHHLPSGMPLSPRQSRVHTLAPVLAERSPDTHQRRRCAASSIAGLQPTLGRRPVSMLAHELPRPAERSLDIALDDGRTALRTYPRGLSRRNRTSRSKGIRPMVRERRPHRK